MDSNFFNNIRRLFEKLPGIGPRQANRFLWALLDFSEEEQRELSKAIAEIPKHIKRCAECSRAFMVKNDEKICSFCSPNSKRDKSKLMVVEKDNDILSIEKSGAYAGLYHVLGGMIDTLNENPIPRERIKKLFARISKVKIAPGKKSDFPGKSDFEEGAIREVILAFSPTKMGEFTSNYVVKVLEPLLNPVRGSKDDVNTKNDSSIDIGKRASNGVKITRLARGLSTGVELEYADEMTLRHALDNRK